MLTERSEWGRSRPESVSRCLVRVGRERLGYMRACSAQSEARMCEYSEETASARSNEDET